MKVTNKQAAIALLFMCIFLWFSCAEKSHYTEALSPEQEMKHFVLDSEFNIELFASEPNVMAPVDMTWDDAGNVYVIEMGDYPDQAQPGKAKGRIRVHQRKG